MDQQTMGSTGRIMTLTASMWVGAMGCEASSTVKADASPLTTERGVKLAPPPPVVPVPELTGAPVDLSTVMGKARKLANQWDEDAALVGIEATLTSGLVQTRDGAAAKLTFGPSRFASARPKSGLFVVTYDQQGLRGAPSKGSAAKVLPEPMCAPESVYARIAEGAQPTISLRYGFDANDRVAWIGLVAGAPATEMRFFDAQRCAPLGIVARGR
jgi:hypothetical protein